MSTIFWIWTIFASSEVKMWDNGIPLIENKKLNWIKRYNRCFLSFLFPNTCWKQFAAWVEPAVLTEMWTDAMVSANVCVFDCSGADAVFPQLSKMGQGPLHRHLSRLQRPLLLHSHFGSHHCRLLAGKIQVRFPVLYLHSLWFTYDRLIRVWKQDYKCLIPHV